MNVILNQPTSQNWASQLGLVFWTRRLPTTNYSCQKANIPGFSLTPIEIGSPLVSLPHTGDHVEYDRLQISFKVTEDFQNYFEMLRWLREIGFPETSDEYAATAEQTQYSGLAPKSTSTLTVLDGKKNAMIVVTFYELFPVSLTGLNLDVTQPDVEYLTADAEFRFVNYDILNTMNATTVP